MINLSLNDELQIEIIKYIKRTEYLITNSINNINGSNNTANVVTLPDLGLPRNIRRIAAGFFVGTFYSWDNETPFVPIDANLNSCGVSLFRLKNPINSKDEFLNLIKKARINISKTSYEWNFDVGNHFISYGEIKNSQFISDGYFVILHSSACEFKRQFNGLYPAENNWYYNSIETYKDKKSDRELRFITGEKAHSFAKSAQMLKLYNQIRLQRLSELIFGEENVSEEVIYCPHYGMPTLNSIAIGCHWLFEEDHYLLLTTKDDPIPIVKAKKGFENTVNVDGKEIILVPHGLGNVSLHGSNISYINDQIKLGETSYSFNDSLNFGKDIAVRSLSTNVIDKKSSVSINDILVRCPGEVEGLFIQKYNYNNESNLL